MADDDKGTDNRGTETRVVPSVAESPARAERRAARALRRIRAPLKVRLFNGITLTLGAIGGALGFNLFLEPGNVAPGGILGLTLVANQVLPFELPNGLLMLALNVPLLYLGYKTLGGASFMFRTLYVVAVMTVAIDLSAQFLPGTGVSDDPLLNALYGGAVSGAANALIIRAFGNMGGTSILGRVIQRRTGMPIGQVYLMTDGLIVVLLGLAFGWERALYSMIALFVSGAVTDYGIEGPSIVRTVFVITEHPRDVAAALQAGLRTGVTAWPGEGMYQGGQRTVLFCTVNRAEVRELRRIVHETDPLGFLVVGQGQSATGGTIGRSDAPG